MSFDPTYVYNGDSSDPRVCDGAGTPYAEDSLFGAARKINDVQDALVQAFDSTSASGLLKRALIGGGEDALDGIDGSTLDDGDTAVTIEGTNPGRFYQHVLDIDNGGAENVPYIIQPDLNAGNKRWVLSGWIPRFWTGAVEPAVSDDINDGVLPGDLWVYSDRLWICANNTAGAAVWLPIIEDHGELNGSGTTSHTALDQFVASKSQASGLASLDGQGKTIQNPAAATATPGVAKIPISDDAETLNSWISDTDTDTKGLIQLAGQLGGTATSPTVIGFVEAGGQALSIGEIADGQSLKRSGTEITGENANSTNAVCEGRLEVLPSYCRTSSIKVWQMNVAGRGIGLRFRPKMSCTIASLSFYVGVVGSAGTLTVSIYDLTAAQDHACGTTASISIEGWFQHTFSQIGLDPTHTYEVRLLYGSGDIRVSYRVSDTEVGSAIPSTCSAWSTIDSWENESQFTDAGTPALPSMVINSCANHVPQLLFGRWCGQYLDIPGTGLMTIPEAGVWLDCSALTANTNYWIYGYDSSGTLTLEASTTAPIPSNGILVKTGAVTRRLLGQIRCPALIDTTPGPVSQPDRRMIQNLYNREARVFEKPPPYVAETSDSAMGATWEGWNGSTTEWRIECLALSSTICLAATSTAVVGLAAVTQQVTSSIAMDTVSMPLQTASISTVEYTTAATMVGTLHSAVNMVPEDGFHYFLPLQAAPAGAPVHYLLWPDKARAQFSGTIVC